MGSLNFLSLFLSISSHKLKTPCSLLNKLIINQNHKQGILTCTRKQIQMKCNKKKKRERKVGLPPSKRSFNVISLMHLPVIQDPTKFLLQGPFFSSLLSSITCTFKQTFWLGGSLSSWNKSKLIFWSFMPIYSIFFPMSTTQLAIDMNGRPRMRGMLVSSSISMTTKSAGNIRCLTFT